VSDELRAVREQLERFRAACRLVGLPVPAQLSPRYERIPDRLAGLATRIHDAAIILADDNDHWLRAVKRHINKLPPAARGEQVKDCAIIEHFLALCDSLRQGGFREKCIFVSSNTKDYCEHAVRLHPNLGREFEAVGLDFVTDFAWARSVLGP
jgi:hypothetical protein